MGVAKVAVAPGGTFWRGRHFGFQIPYEVRIAIWSFQDNNLPILAFS